MGGTWVVLCNKSSVDEHRYGDLTDEPQQMFSAEAAVRADTVIECGTYMAHLIREMQRYLITRN
jgi:hypothetical protein